MVGVIQYAVPILANRMIAAGQWKFTYGSGLHFTYRGINATLSGTGSYTVVPTPETSTPLSPHIYAISISSSTTSVNATTIAGTDGSDTVYTTTTGPNTDSTAAAPFAIGSIFENSESYYPLTGYLHELMVFNRTLSISQLQTIEGYFATKWGLRANLPPTHPYYSTAPTLDTIHDTGSLSIPTLFPSLTMWLDAADSSTVVLAGTSVTNWNDKSPILDVFSGTYPPIYSYTSGPSIPAVYFSGINSLRGTVNAAIASGVGSCFMVASLQNSAAQILMGGYVTGAATAGNTFGFVNTGLTYISPFQGSDRANQHVFTLGFQPPISVLFAQISASVAGGIGAGSVNFGTPTNQPYTVMGTSYSWNPSLPSSSPWVLGYTGASSPAGIQNFYLHEFLCFSEYFGDTQRQMVEGYIAWKWGIQSQLPAGHPYKNARPQSPQS